MPPTTITLVFDSNFRGIHEHNDGRQYIKCYWYDNRLSMRCVCHLGFLQVRVGQLLMTAQFTEFFETFQQTKLWKDMENTHENSPWHREASVSVHTGMLLDWYYDHYFDHRTPRQQNLSLVACLMHDVGKPMAEVTKFSEERGTYRAYHGHELLSARIWTDYALTAMRYHGNILGFNLNDIANVALMVEHHVPFALKDKKKRSALKGAFYHRMGEDGHQAWLDLLNSDQNGRISDDQPKKLADVAVWMQEWEKV